METININGKEYTKEEFKEHCEELDAFIEYWDWDGLVKSSFDTLKDFPRHEPEPPTVRPMSELPEKGVRFNILVIHTIYEAKVWDVGSLVRKNEISDGFRIFKLKDEYFISESSMYKIIGWQPLPNPNDIKL